MPSPEFYTVVLLLPADLYNRLDVLAAEECRTVDQQAYYLLRQHLQAKTEAANLGAISSINDPRRWAAASCATLPPRCLILGSTTTCT